ncbi:MAG: C1 family peptidase [Syntrophales bacterium]
MFRKKFSALILILVSSVFLFGPVSFADELADIQAAVRAKGAKWVAGKTSMMTLTPEERRMRLGLPPAKGTPDYEATPYQETFTSVPASFDWRNVDGNGTSYVTPVRNQGGCGSCWDFAATAGLESYTLITQRAPNTNLDLSEQILLSCYNTNGCNGGSPSGASSYIQTTGLPLETCFQYTAEDAAEGILCSQSCANWQASTYKILNYGGVSATVSAIKDALVNYGPLVTTFSVYGDFFSYNGGIYSYTTGAYQGGHAVLIVGYDDVNNCFIVKNSWGTGWGEAGFFRIDYLQLASPVYFGSGTLTYYASLSAPSITVTSPSSGASWQASTTQAISWTLTGNPGSYVKIDLWKSGAFYATIVNSTSITSSYSWPIPAGLTRGSDYQIVVTSTANSAITGTSGTFSITEPPLPFGASGKVTTGNSTAGIPGVTMTFSRVSGTGAVPGSVPTGSDGSWSQTGFAAGTTYKATPSKPSYSFSPKNSTFSNGNTPLTFIGTSKGGPSKK